MTPADKRIAELLEGMRRAPLTNDEVIELVKAETRRKQASFTDERMEAMLNRVCRPVKKFDEEKYDPMLGSWVSDAERFGE